ncbi:hypothetical protein EPA93_18075 [Ktedonosporobacter rubrisoli]|uniref:DUF3995 domain-containing protein n=1 Tax=Ktedonosporobacter rubrisoli TaxID=2509675 RepID=A0A4P6JSG5_KTERU|nr:hypothetical protein [Ktedonosporobacter rubrisoli]QBD77796.1 hypothetical protein EPA93_18075 [Ktedonosporobacter rubrisoli]
MEANTHSINPGSLPRWPGLIASLAGLWSLLYGAAHLYWLFGGDGYPFKHQANLGLFSAMITYLPRELGAALFVGLCLLGIFASIAMQQGRSKSILRRLLPLYAWGMAAALLLFVPDIDLISTMAYVFRGEFGWSWPLTNQVICIIGAFCWGFTALAYQRRTRQACEYCGRSSESQEFILVRWGSLLTYLAALAPLPYTIFRWGQAFGIPIGANPTYMQQFNTQFSLTALVFGAVCAGGGLLTLGLIQPWGERFPRWFPFIRGKRVPILLAVIPASLVAIAATAAGLIFTFSFCVVTLHLSPPDVIQLDPNIILGTIGPMLLWIPWGILLGLATIAYYYRRRGPCIHCGRGATPKAIA